jgi:hypothetical protein
MKGVVAGLSTAFCYLFIFLAAFTYPFMSQWSLWATFLFYSMMAALGFVFVYFNILDVEEEKIETKSIFKDIININDDIGEGGVEVEEQE